MDETTDMAKHAHQVFGKAESVGDGVEELLEFDLWAEELTCACAYLDKLDDQTCPSPIRARLPDGVRRCVRKVLADHRTRIAGNMSCSPYTFLWFGKDGPDTTVC